MKLEKKENYSLRDYIYRIPGFLITIVCLFSEIYLRVKSLSTPDFVIWGNTLPGLISISIIGMIALGIPLLDPAIVRFLKILKKVRG